MQNADAANGASIEGQQLDAMAALERQARAPAGFVAASSGPEGGKRADAAPQAMAANPDAIDVDIDDL